MKLNGQNFKIKYPAIMGICNITKDSFSDGGKSYKSRDALKNIKNMINNGATIIDIGAESTKPGSDPISYNQEIKKLDTVLKKLPKNQFIISVDTNKLETQEYALKNGAHIINDIYGGNTELIKLSKKYNNGLILMHTPGPPKIMQQKTTIYKNVVRDIRNIFLKKLVEIDKYKISRNKIWFDPGIGFGKNLNQNIEIMNNMEKFKFEKCGIVLGSSRKSWINKIDGSDVNMRLGGSIASVLYCLNKGVNIFRVHDVKETKQAIQIYTKLNVRNFN
tara:strand:+ start:799 stop:1626 length:828 start_codon:yes stop_codon:yes gene_type:complete